jgi:hypothetical protein
MVNTHYNFSTFLNFILHIIIHFLVTLNAKKNKIIVLLIENASIIKGVIKYFRYNTLYRWRTGHTLVRQ